MLPRYTEIMIRFIAAHVLGKYSYPGQKLLLAVVVWKKVMREVEESSRVGLKLSALAVKRQ